MAYKAVKISSKLKGETVKINNIRGQEWAEHYRKYSIWQWEFAPYNYGCQSKERRNCSVSD